MKSVFRKLLRFYIWLHDRYHNQIIARLQQRADDGIHYTNIFNYRFEFFKDNLGPNDVVLDLACGTGTILKKVARTIRQGYGVERSDVNFAHCIVDKPGNVEFFKRDIFDINYQELQQKIDFNVAILSHILEHVEDVPALLRRILAPKILVCVPSRENSYAQLVLSLGLEYRTDDTHYREYTRDLLRQHLEQGGYDIQYMGFNQEGEIICAADRNTRAWSVEIHTGDTTSSGKSAMQAGNRHHQ